MQLTKLRACKLYVKAITFRFYLAIFFCYHLYDLQFMLLRTSYVMHRIDEALYFFVVFVSNRFDGTIKTHCVFVGFFDSLGVRFCAIVGRRLQREAFVGCGGLKPVWFGFRITSFRQLNVSFEFKKWWFVNSLQSAAYLKIRWGD